MSPYMNMWGAMLGAMMGMIVIWIVLIFVMYVLQSVGFYTIAKHRRVRYPWMAWVPFANIYLVGKIADGSSNVTGGKRTNYALLLLVLAMALMVPAIAATALLQLTMMGLEYSVALSALIALAIIAGILEVLYIVFYYIALYKVYNWCSSSAVAMIVCTILLPVILPFVVFAVRNGMNPNFTGSGPRDGREYQPSRQRPPQRY